MPKKLEKFIYNKIEFKNKKEIAWMVMFDLFGWTWGKENEKIFIFGEGVKYEVVVGDFSWGNNAALLNADKFKFDNNVILLNYPKLEFKNHLLGWIYNNGDYVPICALQLDDGNIAMAEDNNLIDNKLSNKKMFKPKYFSLKYAWAYASTFNYKILPRTTDKVAERLKIRFNYNSI